MQSSVAVDLRICTERFHHRLLTGFHMIRMIHDLVTIRQHCIYISVRRHFAGTEIPLIICSHRAQRLPVFFRVHQDQIVLCFPEIQHRLQHLILYLDHLQGSVYGFFRLTCHDRHNISYITHPLIQQESVIRRWFRIRLSGHGKALLRHIFISIDANDSRYLHRNIRLDLFNPCVCMRTSEYLYHQSIGRGNIIYISWFPQQELHGVLLSYRLSYTFKILFHAFTPPSSSSDMREFREAVLHIRNSGRDFLQDMHESHHQKDPDSPAAVRSYS